MEKMKACARKVGFLITIIMIIACTVVPVSASSMKEIERDTTCKKYDLNGDGKKDRFKWKSASEDGYTNLYLNGKKSRVFSARGCFIYVLKYSKKTSIRL